MSRFPRYSSRLPRRYSLRKETMKEIPLSPDVSHTGFWRIVGGPGLLSAACYPARSFIIKPGGIEASSKRFHPFYFNKELQFYLKMLKWIK